jgi:general stress protein YciG
MEKEHAGEDKGHEKSHEKSEEKPATKPKSLRGFASMDSSTQRAIARKGGRAAHVKGTAHKFTPEEARRAGRKGGEIVSRDTAHMALIGRKGGEARRGLAARRKAAAQKTTENQQDKTPEKSSEKPAEKHPAAKESSAAPKSHESMRRSA